VEKILNLITHGTAVPLDQSHKIKNTVF